MSSSSSSRADGLLAEVLSWDIDALGGRQGVTRRDAMRPLPRAFGSAEEYARRYEALLLEEMRCQVHQASAGLDSAALFPEAPAEGEERVALLAISSSAEYRGSSCFSVSFSLDASDALRFRDGDLLLARAEPKEGENPEHIRSAHALACVDRRDERHSLLTRMVLPEQPRTSKNGVPVNASRTHAVRSRLLSSSSPWKLHHLGSMSTAIREWRAVGALSSLPFAEVILRPGSFARSARTPAFSSKRRSGTVKLSTRKRPFTESGCSRHWRASEALLRRLKEEYNLSQLSALQRVLEPTKINLIQGPPGTGKTRTILALLSLALHAAPGSGGGVSMLDTCLEHRSGDSAHQSAEVSTVQHAEPEDKVLNRRRTHNPAANPPSNRFGAMPWLSGITNPRDEAPKPGSDPLPSTENVEPVMLGNNTERSAHILVCAPSNSALDEVAQRLLGKGILDGKAELYEPKCVRVGVRCMHQVRRIFLEQIASQRTESSHPGAKERAKAEALDDASIVFSTLSYAGAAPFARIARPFDAVIVDESTQATEPSNLVPLLQGCKQLFLVGDPSQLPATVISQTAHQKGLSSSMFERFRHAGYPCDLLSEQHRMHPEIRRFPSREFYGAALTDAPGMKEQCKRRWHEYRLFSPFLMLDVVHGEQRRTSDGTSASLVNESEAQLCVAIAMRFLQNFSEELKGDPLAIVTPYRAQMQRVQQLLRKELSEEHAEQVDVSTIDGFQGRENEVVIFSVVRTPTQSGSIGFVADDRRMNVGLTRARTSLLVLGHSRAIADYGSWRRLVSNALRRSCYARVDECALIKAICSSFVFFLGCNGLICYLTVHIESADQRMKSYWTSSCKKSHRQSFRRRMTHSTSLTRGKKRMNSKTMLLRHSPMAS